MAKRPHRYELHRTCSRHDVYWTREDTGALRTPACEIAFAPDAQRVGIEAALDLPLGDERYRPVSSDTTMARIVLFGQAEGRAMPRSELLAQLWIDRQRQKARGRRDAIVLNDHGAVVERRVQLEDAHQQVVRHHGIERDAALDVIAQADLPLDGDDDRADVLG